MDGMAQLRNQTKLKFKGYDRPNMHPPILKTLLALALTRLLTHHTLRIFPLLRPLIEILILSPPLTAAPEPLSYVNNLTDSLYNKNSSVQSFE
jgi:hypothetical protein